MLLVLKSFLKLPSLPFISGSSFIVTWFQHSVMSSHLILSFHVFLDTFHAKMFRLSSPALYLCQLLLTPFLHLWLQEAFYHLPVLFLSRVPPNCFKLSLYFIALVILKLQVLLCAWMEHAWVSWWATLGLTSPLKLWKTWFRAAFVSSAIQSGVSQHLLARSWTSYHYMLVSESRNNQRLLFRPSETPAKVFWLVISWV